MKKNKLSLKKKTLKRLSIKKLNRVLVEAGVDYGRVIRPRPPQIDWDNYDYTETS